MTVLGIGTDITEISRIAKMADRHADSFLKRVYTPNELLYCGTGASRNERLAARWAAKEAVLKALGTGWAEGILWTDVEVVKLPTGAPKIELYGGALLRAKEIGVKRVLISLSHGKDYAVAFATALGRESGTL